MKAIKWKLRNSNAGLSTPRAREEFLCMYIIVDADTRIKFFLEHLPFETAKEFCGISSLYAHNFNFKNICIYTNHKLFCSMII